MTKRRKPIVECFIPGRPVVPTTPMGRRNSPDPWTSQVIDGTIGLPRVAGRCELDVEFVIPLDRDPWEHPWEMSLTNLMKWLLDALEQTLFRSDPGGESQLVSISARQKVARSKEKTGARIAVFRAPVPD